MNKNVALGASIGVTVFAAETVRGASHSLSLAAALIAGIALGAVATYDLQERRIPNRIVLPATAACASIDSFVRIPPATLITAVAVTVALTAIGLAIPTALGMGDAKLALLITTAFPTHAALAIILGLGLATAGGVLVARRCGEPLHNTHVALAPFMAAATALALL